MLGRRPLPPRAVGTLLAGLGQIGRLEEEDVLDQERHVLGIKAMHVAQSNDALHREGLRPGTAQALFGIVADAMQRPPEARRQPQLFGEIGRSQPDGQLLLVRELVEIVVVEAQAAFAAAFPDPRDEVVDRFPGASSSSSS